MDRGSPLSASRVAASALAAGLALASMTPLAQVPGPEVDPGLLLREQLRERELLEERLRELLPPEDPELVVPDPGLPALPDLDISFTLRALRFTESDFLEPEWLEALAEEYVGEVVTFADLNRIVERVNDEYAARGLLTARAFIPPQSLADGEVVILLVEGRVGRVEVAEARHTRGAYIRDRVEVREGEVLDVPHLQRELERFNRREEVRLAAAMQAGEEFGETDVVLQAREPPRWRYQLFVDNAGNESTGEWRGGAFLSLFGPLGRTDRLLAHVVGSRGSRAVDLTYSFPVDRRGSRVDLRAAYNDIDIVRGPLQDIDVEGDSLSVEGRYRRPLHRDRRWWWDLLLSGLYTESETTIEGFSFAENEVLKGRAGVRIQDHGPHVLQFGYFWQVEQHIAAARFEDRAVGESGETVILDGRASWHQRLAERAFSVVRAEWQYTPEPEKLLSPEFFQLGGAFDVRGYPQGVAAGEQGYLLSAEVFFRAHERVEPFLFVDHGMVFQEAQEDETLTGAGAGLFVRLPGGFQGELSAGYAFDEIVPDQDDYQVHFRLAWEGERW